MEFTLSITGKDPAELLSLLQKLNGPAVKFTDLPAEKPAAVKQLKAADKPTNGKSSKPAEEATGEITLETITDLIKSKLASGKGKKMKDLLAKFEVERASALEPEQYEPFMDALKVI